MIDNLKEEQREARYQDGVAIRARKAITSLDTFFEALESDPAAFMDRNHMDICDYTREVERARCIRKITVFKSRLEQLYREFGAFQLELMGNPLYSEVQEKFLMSMSDAIKGYHELIERYEEDILVLDWDWDMV